MKPGLQADVWSFDVATGDLDACIAAVIDCVEQSWASGAHVVLFPEYVWAAPLDAGAEAVRSFWLDAVPKLVARLGSAGRLAVLGTAPCIDEPSGEWRNRAIIICDGQLITQDKLFLTPWEYVFRPGEYLQIIDFRGLRVAVVICLDIEVPELSVLLRGQRVDLILVPSATETALGCERVTRCASARSVELGSVVLVSPLVGTCGSDLVDRGLGMIACYYPSQSAWGDAPRTIEGSMIQSGLSRLVFSIPTGSFHLARRAISETNPSLIQAQAGAIPRLRQPAATHN
jgi:predicted amidohydrolase